MTSQFFTRPILVFGFYCCLTGCSTFVVPEGRTALPSTTQATTVRLFKDSIQPVRYERPSGALATWRQFAEHKPALLLFSVHPLLDPIAEESPDEIRQFVLRAPTEEIIRRGAVNAADTLLVSQQTVSAALNAGLIGELIYVLPPFDGRGIITLDELRERFLLAGFLTETEAMNLTLQDGVIKGAVRGIPLRCVAADNLPAVMAPLLVHIDLSYFKERFVNDVRTPVYQLLQETAANLHHADYATLAITLSYSNQEAEIGLESRFLINDLVDLLQQPNLADNGLPPNWAMRSNIYLLKNMFSERESRELSIRAADEYPDDPAAHYLKALIKLEERQLSEALNALDQAVALDRGYALVYLDMVERAQQIGLSQDQVLMLLEKFSDAFPDNAFVRIQIASHLIEAGRSREARAALKALRRLPWSATFHVNIPAQIDQLSKAAELP